MKPLSPNSMGPGRRGESKVEALEELLREMGGLPDLESDEP